MPGGKSGCAPAMAAWMSWAAASMLRSRVKTTVIWVSPSALVDVIESMPAMVENCRSSGVATAEAMVSARPRQARAHLDGGKVHVGQITHGQLAVGHEAEDEQARHEQRGHDGALDEEICVHRDAPAGGEGAGPDAFTSTLDPGTSRS